MKIMKTIWAICLLLMSINADAKIDKKREMLMTLSFGLGYGAIAEEHPIFKDKKFMNEQRALFSAIKKLKPKSKIKQSLVKDITASLAKFCKVSVDALQHVNAPKDMLDKFTPSLCQCVGSRESLVKQYLKSLVNDPNFSEFTEQEVPVTKIFLPGLVHHCLAIDNK